ncbi:unnamed protein product [Toxocara canis]|uniref:Retinol dehydrogenase 14 n=1 Tax=Toxocara canis TaxID=6265 RepID=A0A183UBK0_TOXCA|nr:unnamed protein product [Toxocara canis]
MKGHLCAFQMDISSEESVMTAKDYVVRQLNKINKDLYAIVNNAGIQAQCMFDDFLTLNAYEEAVEVNAYGPIRVTKLFKDLVKKSKGRIIFCTSAVCRFPAPGMGPYALSKWALTGYVEKMMNSMNDIWARANDSLREEYGEYWLSRGKRVYVDLHDASPSDVTPVSDAYFHAITATCPYKNYVVGLDAMLMFRPFSLLPTRLQELAMKLIEWHYGAPKPAIVD